MLFAEICRCRPTDCSSSPPPSISQGQEEHQPIQGPQVQPEIYGTEITHDPRLCSVA